MDSLRRCCFCFNLFPATEEFFGAGRGQDGLKKRCKSCEGKTRERPLSGAARRKNLPTEQKKQARGSHLLAVRQKRRAQRRLKMIRLQQQIKLERGCVDCGYKDHAAALDFDHIPTKGEKMGNVSRVASQGRIEIMLSEIEKCEVVCANCHRIRTYNRLQNP